jgi:hypothetical protein
MKNRIYFILSLLVLLVFSQSFLCSCASKAVISKEEGEPISLPETIQEREKRLKDRLAHLRALEKLKGKKSHKPKEVIDTVPPAIEVISPKPYRGVRIVNKYETLIEGVALDNSGVAWVTVNGLNAALDEHGNFKREVYLKVGENDITIKAMDTRGNIGTRIVLINRETAEKIVKIVKPIKSVLPKIAKPTFWLLSIGVSDYRNKVKSGDTINLGTPYLLS